MNASEIHFVDTYENGYRKRQKDSEIEKERVRGEEEREIGKGWQHPETFSPSQS